MSERGLGGFILRSSNEYQDIETLVGDFSFLFIDPVFETAPLLDSLLEELMQSLFDLSFLLVFMHKCNFRGIEVFAVGLDMMMLGFFHDLTVVDIHLFFLQYRVGLPFYFLLTSFCWHIGGSSLSHRSSASFSSDLARIRQHRVHFSHGSR